jgi:penicillin-binding protein 1A
MKKVFSFKKKNLIPESLEPGNPRKKWLRVVLMTCFIGFLGCLLIGFIGAAGIYFYFADDLPDVTALKKYQPSTITRLYSDNDDLIAEFYIEKRIVVPMSRIPLQLKQAALAVEDSNFYYHFGIDPKSIFRAFLSNMKAGRVVEGGSTITQQLSKTLFLSREKKLARKIKEAILAIRMELVFTKDEILEMYFNQIYYGHGSYGVEAASRTYFGKHVQDLSLEECAMLAGLPKAPNNYSPYRNPEKAKKRRDHALRRMASMRFISKEESEIASLMHFNLGEVTDMLNEAPYFVDYMRQYLEDLYGSTKLYHDGLKVFTTLNIDYQKAAQQSIRQHILQADKRFGYRGPVGKVSLSRSEEDIVQALTELNKFQEGEGPVVDKMYKGVVTEVNRGEATVRLGAMQGILKLENMDWARKPNILVDGKWARIQRVTQAISKGDMILVRVLEQNDKDGPLALALDQIPEVEAALMSVQPVTGQIKAMVGGYDFKKSQFNRAVQAIRQPGSAFKPIIYAAAIIDGYSPASIIIDSPIIFKEKEEAFDKWKPVNFEKKFYGPTSLRTALTHSRNIVTVKLLQNIGINRAIQMVRDLGINSHMENNLSIALGSSGVTLYEITSAYSSFANMGRHISPTAVRYINNRDDETLYVAEPDVTLPMSSGVAYTITSLLQSVVEDGTGKKVKALGRPVAGKTGTTNNYVDAWFLGYTPQLVTGVWVGKDSVEPLGKNETGSRTAIPIWLQFMQEAHKDLPIVNFPISDEINFSKISPETGDPIGFGNPAGEFEVFVQPPPPEAPEVEASEETPGTF